MDAEVLKNTGLGHFNADRYSEAAAAFDQAALAFEAAGRPADAAEMRNNLCVVKMSQDDFQGALAAVEGTEAVFAAAGDPRREAQAIANRAACYEGLGRVEDALQTYQRAIDLLGDIGESDTRAACYKRISGLQVKSGQQLQALASMRSGLDLTDKPSMRERMLKGMLDKAVKGLGMK